MGKFNANKFKLAGGVLNDASKQVAPKPDEMIIKYKSIEEIVPHVENKYSLSSIQELADNIRTVGRIQQPIIYLDPPMEDGRNKIIAGHRRYEAYKLLSNEDPKWGNSIPCTPITLDHVKLPISDESKERYLILTTNIDNRNKTDADVLFEYREQKSIYEEAKRNGYMLTGKMRHIIANDLGLSAAQIGKIEYLEKHAAEPVKEALTQNHISIANANQIAHKPEEEQRQIIEKVNETVNNTTSDNLDSNIPDTKKEVQKAIKTKIIDTLDKDYYDVNLKDQFSTIEKEFDELKNTSKNPSISKKDYAKLLTAEEKILDQINKLKKLVNSFSE